MRENNLRLLQREQNNIGSGGQNIQKDFLNIKPVLHFKRQFLLT